MPVAPSCAALGTAPVAIVADVVVSVGVMTASYSYSLLGGGGVLQELNVVPDGSVRLYTLSVEKSSCAVAGKMDGKVIRVAVRRLTWTNF